MYKRIIVAYDESLQAKLALTRGIELAKQFGSELHLVTVSEPLPAYVAFIEASFPGAQRTLANDRINFYSNLQKEAQEQAKASGLSIDGDILEGNEVDVIVDHINAWNADLLVIGRRRHSSHMTLLWGSTVHDIAEKARCSILAVY